MNDNEWIRKVVVARADTLGLTAYAVATRTGGRVLPDTVKNYFEGRSGMTTTHLQHVLDVLGLTLIVPRQKRKVVQS